MISKNSLFKILEKFVDDIYEYRHYTEDDLREEIYYIITNSRIPDPRKYTKLELLDMLDALNINTSRYERMTLCKLEDKFVKIILNMLSDDLRESEIYNVSLNRFNNYDQRDLISQILRNQVNYGLYHPNIMSAFDYYIDPVKEFKKMGTKMTDRFGFPTTKLQKNSLFRHILDNLSDFVITDVFNIVNRDFDTDEYEDIRDYIYDLYIEKHLKIPTFSDSDGFLVTL